MNDFFPGKKPIPATLHNWAPKCNAEGEKRLRLDFEIPLTEDALANAPDCVAKAETAIAAMNNGVIESALSNEYPNLLVEVYLTSDHTSPVVTLTGMVARKLIVFRPTPADGGNGGTFLQFKMDTSKSETSTELVSWALEHLKATVFLSFHEQQAQIFDGKSAAANDDTEAPAAKKRGGKKPQLVN